ncbi:hypothetical protein F4083_07075 [Candidatus Poribacteria bacterium]|nr:hypothetical protein [Candidatus Poribacteria bacterium]
MKLTFKILFLSLLLLIPLHIDAAQEYKFVGEFGGKGEGEAQFAKTLSMAFGEDGNIYITDTDNFRIHKYTETGNYVFQIRVDESSDFRFINPTALTIGTDNAIYVMDWLLKHIPETGSPKIFNYGPCVHKFDPQGKFIASYPIQDLSKRVNNLEAAAPGLDSEGNYALIIPHGDTKREFLLAVDNNDTLYVCDDGIIYRLDATGKPTTHFAISQPGAGQVIHPADMTVDKNGNLYIVDERAHRVVQYGSDGKFIRTFGVYGDGDGEFMSPHRIVFLKDGSLLVADKAKYIKDFVSTLPNRLDDPTPRYDGFSRFFRYRLRRIQKFTHDGRFIRQILVPFQREAEEDVDLKLRGIDRNGNLYYLNTSYLTFRKYAPTRSIFSSMFQTELKFRLTRDIHDIEIDNQDDLDADLYTRADFDEQIIQDAVNANITFSYDFNEDYRLALSNRLMLIRMTDTSYYRAQDFEDFRGTFNQDDRSTETSWDNRIQLDFTWIRNHSVYNYREARAYVYFSTTNLDFINDALDRSNSRFFDFTAKLSDWGGGLYYDLSRKIRLNFEITHFFGKNNYTYIDETDDLYATGFQQADTLRAVLFINGFF